MNKIAIVLNGAGGVGKDTLCDIAAKHFKVRNISTITPIKEIAAMGGWNGAKDDKSRKFLADLKQLFVDYNDYPTNWALAVYREFLTTDEEILFVHIREPEEIAKFISATDGRARAMLIRGGDRMTKSHYGNYADDSVENFTYDYYYTNDRSLEETERAFTEYLREILGERS